jgi:WD40 repeat protein
MPKLLTCPQGHQWEQPAGPWICPVCGAALEQTLCGPPPDTDNQTLAFSASPRAQASPAHATTPGAESPDGAIPTELAEHTRYRVLGLLRGGGMGMVFKAEHRLMERPVALKVIASGLIDDPAAVARFQREVKTAARLSHPNIVQAYDADQAGPLHFLVMEYVEGTDLAQLVAQRGPLPVAQACDYARQAALGLQHAFEHGMVHRDIKPHNLMRTPDGQVKVLDFGLSRFLSESGRADDPTEADPAGAVGSSGASDTALTQAGSLMGTADYIAPEQTKDAHAADIRADVYSLGCTLYFLLAGHGPFPGGTIVDKLQAHRARQPPPLTELRGDLPPALLRVVERMLAKEPGRRYQTPAEVAQALSPFTRRPRRRWWPLAAAVVLVALLGLAGYHYGPDALRFATNTGQILVESERADARVRVRRNGEPGRPLEVTPGQLTELPAGTYEVEMVDGQKGLQAVPGAFTLDRGGQAVIALLPDEIRRFQGHGGHVWSVAFSPDGHRALSGSADRTMRLWDVETGKELRRFKNPAWVDDVAFSPDGRLALSCTSSPDNSLWLWDVETGVEVRRFQGHTGTVRKLAFSPDGRQIVSGSYDGTVRLWDVASGTEVRKLANHRNMVEGVAFSPNGRRALSSSQDGTLRLWDLATGQFRELKGHQGAVMRAVFSADGRRILSGGNDRTVRLWDAATGQLLRTFEGHTGRVECVAFSPDGRHALSGGAGDETLHLWDVARGQELYRFEGHGGDVMGVAFSPDGRRALSASSDATLRLWRVPDARQLARLAARLPVVAIRSPIRVFVGHTGPVRSVALSPDGRYALSGGGLQQGDRTMRLWDVATGKEFRQFMGHTGPIQSVAFSPDGRQALSGCRDHLIRLWDVESGKLVRVFAGQLFAGHTDVVNSVTFSPDGRLALSGSFDKTLRLWDVASGKELRTFAGHTMRVLQVAFSPDGGRALSASDDKTMRLWDVASGKELHCFRGHADAVECVAFSPDGHRALSGSYDTTIRLWDLESKQELGSFTRHRSWVNSVTFSRDGRRALSASADRTIRLWDVASRRERCRFEGHTDQVWSAVFSTDERYILSCSSDRTLRLWEAPP